MKKLKEQLQAVSKELVKLSKQLDKATAKVDQLTKAEAKKTTPRKTTARKTAAKKPAAKKTAAPKAPAKKKTTKAASETTASSKPTVLDTVYDVIGKSRNGATIAQLKEKTGLTPRQLSNALYKLSTRGKIVAKSRGLYAKK